MINEEYCKETGGIVEGSKCHIKIPEKDCNEMGFEFNLKEESCIIDLSDNFYNKVRRGLIVSTKTLAERIPILGDEINAMERVNFNDLVDNIDELKLELYQLLHQ